MGEHVVAEQEVGAPLAPPALRAVSTPKNSTTRGHALGHGDLRDVGGGLDAEHRHPALDEVLQEVAVVGGELHDVARSVEAPPLDHLLDVAARVLQPGRRVRREVGVVGEDRLGALELLELDEQAPLADERAQRIEGLIAFARSGGRYELASGDIPRSAKTTSSGAPQKRHEADVMGAPRRASGAGVPSLRGRAAQVAEVLERRRRRGASRAADRMRTARMGAKQRDLFDRRRKLQRPQGAARPEIAPHRERLDVHDDNPARSSSARRAAGV